MSRYSKMHADIQAIIRACDIDEDCPFKDFDFTEQSFSFNYYEDNTLLKYFTFNLSEDYPDHTVLTTCGQPGSHLPCETKAYHQRLPVIFRDLSSDLYKDMAVDLPGTGQRSRDTMDDDSSNDVSDDDDDDEHDDGSEDGEEEEEEEVKMNAQLAHDIERVKKLFGNDTVKYRAFHSIDDIDVSLHIEMMLDSETAAAWKVMKDEPIIIRLHLSLSQYLEGRPAKVDVFQPSQKEKFGIGSQLCKIIESFINSNWSLAMPEKPTAATGDFATGDASECTSPAVSDDALAQILSMGFPLDLAQTALLMTQGDTEQAVNLLVSDPQCLREDQPAPVSLPKLYSRHLGAVPALREGCVKAGVRPGVKKMKAGRQMLSTWMQSPIKKMSVMCVDDSKVKAMHGVKAKEVPSLESGFLVQVMRYARQRLLTLNEFCVICDEPHVFQNGAMLKPAVCARDLCVFSFQTLGVMSDAAEDIATQPEVVDVLVTMATAACGSQRRELVFDPYPTVVHPLHPSDLAFNPKTKDFDQVSKVLQAFMTMQQMTNMNASKLTQELDRLDILAYPLLQWIITSNRSHIVKLPPSKQLSFMHTCHQFLLLSSPPAKEAIFRAERAKYGSTFAFHGSPLENWHSILRHGLMKASGTKMQMNGQVYGKGIYLSPMSGTSFGYSRIAPRAHSTHRTPPQGARHSGTPDNKERFLHTKNPTCVALCEVVTSGELKKCTNVIWLTTNPDHVCTRFFFVYEHNQTGDSEVDTQSDVYKNKILQAVQYQFR